MKTRACIHGLLIVVLISVSGCGRSSQNQTGQEQSSSQKKNLGESSTSIDKKDPVSVAKAVLNAYKNKDLKQLSPLSLEVNRKIFLEIAEKGKDHPRYSSIFSGGRWDAVAKWDTNMADARKVNESTVKVMFLKTEDNNAAVVILQKQANGHWLFEDVGRSSYSDFEKLSPFK